MDKLRYQYKSCNLLNDYRLNQISKENFKIEKKITMPPYLQFSSRSSVSLDTQICRLLTIKQFVTRLRPTGS